MLPGRRHSVSKVLKEVSACCYRWGIIVGCLVICTFTAILRVNIMLKSGVVSARLSLAVTRLHKHLIIARCLLVLVIMHHTRADYDTY